MPSKKKSDDKDLVEETAQDEVEEKVEEEENGEGEVIESANKEEEAGKAVEEDKELIKEKAVKQEEKVEESVEEAEASPAKVKEDKEEKPPTPGAEKFKDKPLQCKDCGAEFVWTAGQQAFYAEKGFEHPPLRCDNCRKLKKQRFKSRRRMYLINCSNCGKQDNVPFEPREGQEVLCWDCFKSAQGGQSA